MTTGNEGLLLAEEAALKSRISGIYAPPDAKATPGSEGTPVPVHFRFPEGEKVKVVYPFITIDFLGIQFAADRAHAGPQQVLKYSPSEDTEINSDPMSDTSFVVDYPVPVDLFYQVTTWSRNPRQDRRILGQLMKQDRLPLLDGWMLIPEDETWRRLHVLSVQPLHDKDERGFVAYRNTIMLNINAELVPGEVERVKARTVLFSETFGTAPVYGTIAVY